MENKKKGGQGFGGKAEVRTIPSRSLARGGAYSTIALRDGAASNNVHAYIHVGMEVNAIGARDLVVARNSIASQEWLFNSLQSISRSLLLFR